MSGRKYRNRRKKKRRIWIAGISGLLALVFLAGGISMVRFYRSDYGKLKRAADQYDFRLAAVRMSQYVNEKYGEEVVQFRRVIRLSLGSIQSPILSGVRAGIRGGIRGKVIYMLYLSKEKVVVSGNFSVGGDFRRSDAGSC